MDRESTPPPHRPEPSTRSLIAKALIDLASCFEREQRQTAEHQLGLIRDLRRQDLLNEQLRERRRVRAMSITAAAGGPAVGAGGLELLRQVVAAQAADNALLSAPLRPAVDASADSKPLDIKE